MKLSRIVLFFSLLFLLSGAAQAGSITGTAVYEGKIPKFKEIKMGADPICLTHHTKPVYPETLVLGEGNTMANIFVHVKSGLPKKEFPTPTEPVVVTQKGCQYAPHVIGIMVGQPMKILNPDGTLHNIHAMPKINKEFNLAMPKFRKETTKSFSEEEFMFPMKCDVHPWMGAWISVMSHPYFDVTEKDGKFTIANLPPGNYVIEAWHEKLGTRTAPAKVGPDGAAEVNFTFSRPSKK